MREQANILSFDDARSSRARTRARLDERGGRRAEHGSAERPRSERDAERSRFGRQASEQRGKHGSASQRPRKEADRRRDPSPSAKHGRNEEPGSSRGALSSLSERARSRKRARAKERAEKQFSRQFESTGAAPEQAGPRAAVYKGEMGAAHKRAFRMQSDGRQKGGSSTRAAAPASLGGVVSKIASSRKAVIGIGVAACAVALCAFLYTPAQQYYHAVRAHDQAAAELAVVQSRNEALSESVDQLGTDAGVEAQARDELGWVGDGEVSVYVQGLEGTSEEDGEETTAGSIQPGSIEAPETWYSPILDVIFGEG